MIANMSVIFLLFIFIYGNPNIGKELNKYDLIIENSPTGEFNLMQDTEIYLVLGISV